uniref:RING-type domain-containing protein n=1 Tax=Oryza punctata TaxID=4537 RepID=A0A0E0K7M8_ORYPU
MPSRSRGRGRRLPPPHPPLIQEFLDDDLFDVEVNYSDEEESDEEEEEDDDEQEEGVPGQESIGEGCGPALQARVSGGAVEKNACPVCMEAWASEGAHRICCIPCGHIYGRSCLERWLRQKGNTSATCPQCGKRFRHKDITNLYAPEVAVPNNDREKEIFYLKGKCESLEETVMKHEKRIEEMNERLVELTSAQKRQILSEQRLLNVASSKRQKEFFMDGLRVMAIDAFNQTILASGKAPGVGQEHVLCKCPGWSCSADESSHQICAGLQVNLLVSPDLKIVHNGNLIIFDIRQTLRPLHSMVGLSTHPVHTLHTVIDNNGSRKFLSASSIGPCMWDTDGNQGRPKLLGGTDNQRVCISLACAPSSSDLLVASFRPKVDTSEDATASQVYLSQTPTPSGGGKLGYHSLIRRAGNSSSFTEDRTCSTFVSEIRMSKSAIIPYGNNQHLFAYGDESLRGVRTWRLPSFEMHSDLSSLQQPVLDLRYAESSSGGRYLGYLSMEKLQVFRIW